MKVKIEVEKKSVTIKDNTMNDSKRKLLRIHQQVKLETICNKQLVVKKKYQKAGRPYRYCWFVGGRRNNQGAFTFNRITPIPKTVLIEHNSFYQYSRYQQKIKERREQLDWYGLSRSDKRYNLRRCSDHELETIKGEWKFILMESVEIW